MDRPLPCVVDTNVVMRDVLRRARKGHTALSMATQVGAITTFAAIHVIDEVTENLPELACRQRVDNAMEVWKAYSRSIKFIELPPEVPPDERVLQVAHHDKDDLPTAILVVMLAPCISLSEDPHLVDAGLASPEWLRLALSSRDIAYAQAIRELGGFGIAGTGLTLAGAGKLVIRAAKSPFGRAGLATAAVMTLLALQRSQRSGWQGPRKVGGVLEQAITAYFREAVLSERKRAVAEAFISKALVPSRQPTRGLIIGRTLALADDPMTATEIARTLVPEDHPVPRKVLIEVQGLLSRSPMFRRATTHRWELQTWEVA